MNIEIGYWVRRPGKTTKWHYVESLIAEDAITRCGRRMDRVNTRGRLQVMDVMPLTRMIGQPQLCKQGCENAPRPDVSFEEDASTAPVDPTTDTP